MAATRTDNTVSGLIAVATGIAVALPPGTEGQVRPRSGLAVRHGVTVLNAPGTIDADYRGEILVILVNLGPAPFTVDQIRDLFLGKLVIEYDHVLVLTIASSRSPIYQNAQQAAHTILTAYKPVRQKAGDF